MNVKKKLLLLGGICVLVICILSIISTVYVLYPYDRRLNPISDENIVSIKAFDNIELVDEQWLSNEEIEKWVILVHSYRMNHTFMYSYRMNHTFMYSYAICNINKDAKIVLHCVSMGVAVITVAATEVQNNVKCIIEDCSYTSVKDYLSIKIRQRFRLAEFPIIQIARGGIRVFVGFDIVNRSPEEVISKIEIPVLFIHRKSDESVLYTVAEVFTPQSKERKKYFL